MIYLLDSTMVSDWMREHPSVEAHLARLSTADRAVVCTIVRGEILYGIHRLPLGKRRERLEERAAKAFVQLHRESVPKAAADVYARIRIEQERKGLALDMNDLWIAATTLALGAALVTRDSDFWRIDGLAVEDWSR